jgi:hypothetical protein
MNPAARQVILLSRGLLDPTSATLRRYGTPAFYVGDTNPLSYTQSGIAPSYLESTGVTPASASAQTLGLLLDRSQGAALGAELLTDTDFDVGTGWNPTDVGITFSAGACHFTAVSTGQNISQTITGPAIHAGGVVTFTISNYSAGAVRIEIPGVVIYLPSAGGATANGTYTYRVPDITAGSQTFRMRCVGTTTLDIESVSFKPIAGNHLYQSTSADEPTLINSSNLWRLRGDGVSDNFLTTLVPATSMTLMVACVFNGGDDTPIGTTDGVGGRCFIRQSSGGILTAGVGAQSGSTIFGGSSITGVPGVASLAFNGSTVRLFWKPYNGLITKIYEAAQSGSPTTAVPFRLLSHNDNGTASNFLDGDIYRALAIQSALTDDEIATIATQWARELRWTP